MKSERGSKWFFGLVTDVELSTLKCHGNFEPESYVINLR